MRLSLSIRQPNKLPGPLLAVLILAAGSWFLVREPNVEFKEYTDPEGRFSFEYPASWVFIDELDLKRRNENFELGLMRGANEPSTAMGIIVKTGQAEVSLAELEKQLDQELPRKLTDFAKLGAAAQNLTRPRFLIYHYRYLHLDKARVRQKQKIILTNEAVYWFSVSALDDRFEAVEPLFDRIFKTVKVR